MSDADSADDVDGGVTRTANGTDRSDLPEQCRVCNHPMRESLTPGKTAAKCSHCGWRWSV